MFNVARLDQESECVLSPWSGNNTATWSICYNYEVWLRFCELFQMNRLKEKKLFVAIETIVRLRLVEAIMKDTSRGFRSEVYKVTVQKAPPAGEDGQATALDASDDYPNKLEERFLLCTCDAREIN